MACRTAHTRFKRLAWRTRLAVLAAGLAVAGVAGALAQDITFFRIGTGTTAGTYFPVGTTIASVISNPPGSRSCEEGGSCGVSGLIAVAQTTAGSVENVKAVAAGHFESGLSQSDVVHWAYHGQAMFKGEAQLPNLRLIANLYPESIHLVARKDAKIASVKNLRGKRVSLDAVGSGTRADALLILRAYGMTEKDLKAVSVKSDQAASMIIKGELDAYFFIGGYPALGVADLAERGLIELVPLVGPEAAAIIKRDRFFTADTIPEGTYADIGDVRTLSVNAQWVVSAASDADVIYRITKALWHENNRRILDAGHQKGRLIRIETALKGVSIPLHPGAERYYQEIGVLDQASAGSGG
jgi:TRAP transporter TAXI family solute receptor